MRTLGFLAALLLGASAALAGPEIFWRETFHNFGAFNEDSGPARCTFRYVNTGDEPLVILRARTTCGCTLADWSRSPLAPGDSAEITVEYDPTGRLGRFEKGVIVDTNTPARRSELTIKGVVVGGEASVKAQYPVARGPLALQRASVLVGDVPKGHMRTAFLNVYNRSNDTIAPALGPMPDCLHISLEPGRIPPGEQAAFIIYFRSDRTDIWGLQEIPVSVSPDGPDGETFTLPVTASVIEDFSKMTEKERAKAPVVAFEPERLDLGKLSRTESPRTAAIHIANRGKRPLEIRRVWTPDPGLSVAPPRKTTVKPGRHAEITVTVDPASLPGDILNARVTIITNDPASPQMNVRVVGELTD